MNRFPLSQTDRVVFLKAILSGNNVSVGDYSYYDDPTNAENFQQDNILYHYDFVGDRLEIGKFCALATGTTFIMNGANHRMDGPSTFPFPIFGGAWTKHKDLLADLPSHGDTLVGNDVWFGYKSLIMPGIKIGHGAIIASAAVVTKDVPPYAVIGGNPAQILKYRFEGDIIERLLTVAWWDWPIEHITQHVRTIMTSAITDLEAVAPSP